MTGGGLTSAYRFATITVGEDSIGKASMEIPKGLCQCGCGQPTGVWKSTSLKRGRIKGEHHKYIQGHQTRKSPIDYIVDPVTGCWVWQRSKNNKGYGTLGRKGKRVYAHVEAYIKAKGLVPEGKEIDHTCRRPACVNPDHLEAVTHTVNIRRSRRTTFTEEIVREIKTLNSRGIGYRRLAKRFNVHRSTICHLITERNWKGVNVTADTGESEN